METLMKMKWKIGSVEIENPFILAPMAGVTDLPFRILCKEQGAGLLCTEMVSAKAISFHNKNTISLMQIDPVEHPVSMQIFGSEPDLMAEVAKSIEEQPFDILDINMGCPVPKVVNNGEGSALLKNPELIREIVTKVSHAVKKPVTAKIRIGFEGYPVDPVEIAKIIPVQLQLRSTEEQDSSIMQAKRTGIRSAGSKKRYLFQSLETGMWILQRKQKHWCVRQAVMGS